MVNITKSFGKEVQSAQRTRRSVMGLLALMWGVGCGGVFTGIPDLDTPDGRVFAQRCGGCHGTSYGGGHGVPDPRFRTMAEWQEVLPKMDRLIRERGLPPLTESEREAIIRYLGHHAKT
jgi:mono/diheme cytochrome c family protein